MPDFAERVEGFLKNCLGRLGELDAESQREWRKRPTWYLLTTFSPSEREWPECKYCTFWKRVDLQSPVIKVNAEQWPKVRCVVGCQLGHTKCERCAMPNIKRFNRFVCKLEGVLLDPVCFAMAFAASIPSDLKNIASRGVDDTEDLQTGTPLTDGMGVGDLAFRGRFNRGCHPLLLPYKRLTNKEVRVSH